MGFNPDELYAMSVWEYSACIKGWNKAHGGDKPEPPTEDEFDKVLSRMVH